MSTRTSPSSRRIAYLTTEYPKASHTFIRREIRELERRGHAILRLAIRSCPGGTVDEADREEAAKTFHCLDQPWLTLVWTAVVMMVRHPLAWWRAARIAIAMNSRSDRGIVRHGAYLVEAATILKILRRNAIEHLHVHFGTNAAAVARLVRTLGGPAYSVTIHGPNEFDSPRTLDLTGKVRDAAFIVAISDYCAAQIRRWVPYEQWGKIHIVRCMVDDGFFETNELLESERRTFVCIGRLVPQKGQHMLVEAMRRLQECGLQAKLVIIGEGEMRAELERRIVQHRLHDHIEMTGWADEVAVKQHLRKACALVQPSFAEGLPVVIMEAMAMGRPVIASRIAGTPELVSHEEHGWLITPGNIDELTAAMAEALELPISDLQRMGDAARLKVRAAHSAVAEGAKMESLLMEDHRSSAWRGGIAKVERRTSASSHRQVTVS